MTRLRLCKAGCIDLIIFLVTTYLGILFLIPAFFGRFDSFISYGGMKPFLFWLIVTGIFALVEALIFWIGIITVYLTSVQLGIRYRILGIALGWVFIANIVMLIYIIRICLDEVSFEKEKILINKKREDSQICKTKYPILLVHGVFFRDFKHLNYWGRIPDELIKNGATVYYGNHNSASAVDDSAVELENRINQIIKETGCKKVNVIAHSKGGLDTRTAISKTSLAQTKYIASLTTINTPHRGCEFADYLLSKVPEKQKQMVANAYNKASSKLGDKKPDFLAAVYDLTSANCAKRNEEVFDDKDVYYQSVGSKLNRLTSGRFPLNMTYNFVKYFDGPNDGLVGEKSFKWGENYQFLTTRGNRGISHADMIDLNRENFEGFDVREYYVQLVADLKNKGF